MSYAAPIIPLIDNAINLDAIIQSIQLRLGRSLPWLDYSFGKAVAGYEPAPDGTGRTKVYPHAYAGDGQYQDVGPNNNYAAHSFLQIGSGGERLQGQYDKFQQNQYKANLELIFLFNLEMIKAKLEYEYNHRFTEELKQQVRRVLSRIAEVDSVDAIFETPTEVLRGYTYNETERQNFAHPFGGLKFVISVSYLETC